MNNTMSETLQNTAVLEIPTSRNEEWKFTPVNKYYDATLPLVHNEPVDASILQSILSRHYEDIQANIKGEQKGAYRLIVVNGIIDKAQSVLPSGDVLSIKQFTDCTEEELASVNTIVETEGNYFATKNADDYHDGIYLSIAKNAALDRPIHIIHIYIQSAPSQAYSRLFVQAQQGSHLDIIETYCGQDGAQLFVNAVAELNLQDQAIVNHYDIQKAYSGFRQVKHTEAAQSRGSNYSNYTFNTPGGDFYRNNLDIHLNAEGLECHLYGLYLTDKKQLVDNHTAVHHKYPNGESNQHYKGLLMDESKAVFNGKIFVYEDAQKTNAFQQSNNILFSDRATINAKPQLEIFADDVKCSHGTTIGQLDEQALFYLKSRGISEANAMKMLANAFAYDVAEKIKNPALKHYVEEQISQAMGSR